MGKKTILVVDDAKENINILGELLKEDYNVRAAINGEKALVIAASENKPDLILLDVVMPHMTGVTLARRIRERKERAEILFLTVSKEYAVEAFSVKASGYLIKPVNQSAFEDAVLDCIHRLSPENNPSLLLKSKEGIHRISICELMCVESFNHNQVCTL